MRRLAIVLLTCLGLTLTVSGPAGAAKAQPLPELQLVGDPQAATAVPDWLFPDYCLVPLTWDAAPTAPKGTSLQEYRVAWDPNPNVAWESHGAQPFAVAQGDVRVLSGAAVYLNVQAVYAKSKGKYTETFTPYGAADGPYTWTC
jgi:hypothetical protein